MLLYVSSVLTGHKSRVMPIHLPSGHTAIVDMQDYAMTLAYRWHLMRKTGRNTGYVQGRLEGGGPVITLHRLILGFPEVHVDHINRDTLDNRRSNLRLATRQQNAANAPTRNKTGFKGVTAFRDKWRVRSAGKYIGLYDTPEEAARAYDEIALVEYGEFAYLNFPKEHGRG